MQSDPIHQELPAVHWNYKEEEEQVAIECQ
jgi:hypothetical protein